MTNHDVESLANALYEGFPSLKNLAEEMAKRHGQASALSFFALMDEEVQFFWRDIARQILKHSEEWKPNEGSCCVLSEREMLRLGKLRVEREMK